MKMFADLLPDLKGKQVHLWLKTSMIQEGILDDLIFNEELDKKGNRVLVLWGVAVITGNRRIYQKMENIESIEEIMEEERN